MPIYDLDTTGTALANKITGEQKILTPSSNIYNVIVPTYAPFYEEGLSISYRDLANNVRPLVVGQDFVFTHQFIGATRAIGKAIYGSIELLNLSISGTVTLTYQTLGGQWAITPAQLTGLLGDVLRNPRTTTWEVVSNVPEVFPPTPHAWNTQDLVGQSDLVAAITEIAAAIAAKATTSTSINLPAFYPTKGRVGLSNVDNFPTANDVDAQAGSSPSRFMTPRGVALYTSVALAAYEQARAAKFTATAMPTTGSYTAGDYVSCTDMSFKTQNGTGAFAGLTYNTRGWKRLTTSATHVLNTDWLEEKIFLV